MIQAKSDVRDRSYAFSLEIIKLARELPTDYVSRIIMGQLLRSATSIGANIMEAQAGSSKKTLQTTLT
ncbi:MAG: four helix bundle protein [Dehalococcoidales bacterium]|nr:four helix bundle protein [Dehalococcoidales bacterium]